MPRAHLSNWLQWWDIYRISGKNKHKLSNLPPDNNQPITDEFEPSTTILNYERLVFNHQQPPEPTTKYQPSTTSLGPTRSGRSSSLPPPGQVSTSSPSATPSSSQQRWCRCPVRKQQRHRDVTRQREVKAWNVIDFSLCSPTSSLPRGARGQLASWRDWIFRWRRRRQETPPPREVGGVEERRHQREGGALAAVPAENEQFDIIKQVKQQTIHAICQSCIIALENNLLLSITICHSTVVLWRNV